MTDTATKTCPGYGPDGPHDLPATTEYFHKNAPSKDGLFNQCKPHANAYQGDWMAKRKAIAAAQALPEGSARSDAIEAASALPPVSRRKATADVAMPSIDAAAAAATPTVVAATGIAANTPRDQYVQAQGGQPGWGITTIAGAQYPIPTDAATTGTPEGQAALEAVGKAKRAQGAQAKRDQRARAKAQESATA